MATTSDVVNVDALADVVEAGASDLSCRPHDARQVANAIRMATVRRPNTRFMGSPSNLADRTQSTRSCGIGLEELGNRSV